jgi:Predicted transcriptional regulators
MDNEFRRIFLKLVVLKIIRDQPAHGYEIIKTIEQNSNGRWTPSAGSIYPALDDLEKKGFIQSEEIERKKVYAITPKGEIALERMVEKKRQMVREMTRYIDDATVETDQTEQGR